MNDGVAVQQDDPDQRWKLAFGGALVRSATPTEEA